MPERDRSSSLLRASHPFPEMKTVSNYQILSHIFYIYRYILSIILLNIKVHTFRYISKDVVVFSMYEKHRNQHVSVGL